MLPQVDGLRVLWQLLHQRVPPPAACDVAACNECLTQCDPCSCLSSLHLCVQPIMRRPNTAFWLS